RYGDIHAVNPSEKWYSVITMLVGIGFFFGPILGYMASTLTNSESKRAKYTHRMGVISEHLNDKSVSSWTQNKVKGYYEYLWTRHQGDVKSGLFTDLPLSFQAEIALAQNKHVLEKAPLFRNIPLECLRMITVAIQPISYLPKQFIFSKDDIKHTLFYIKKGSVEVLDENDEKPIKLLREGSFFGEVSLLLNIPRCATVRALSYCELLALERCDLTKIMKHFPEVSEQLLQTIQRRCEEAATHIDNKKKGIIKNYGPDRKRFTIDKAVIILADFMDENEGTTATSCSRAANGHLLFHPKDPFLKRWKIVMTVSAVCFCFFHTYVMAYKTSFGRTGYGTNNTLKAMFALLYLMDMMYLIDIYIQIRTAIIDDSAGLCSDSMTLLKRYFKTYNVILDVLTVFPLEILALTAAGNTDKCWILVTFLRANRLVKIYKLFELLQDFLADIHFNVVIVHIIKLAFMILFITHTCGCVWFIQACFGDTCDPDSWADAAGITADTSMFDAYTRSIYWAAATMTSTGYGDITAGTSRGEFIVLFVLIIGLLMYGYCLSSIAAILTNSLSAKIEFTGRIIGVTSFMSEQNLNQALIERVERYLGLVWRIHKGQAIPGAELLMGDLPMRLQEEVAYEEMHKIIMKVPIFMNTDDSFMRQLTAKLITYVFMPGDTIVYSGDVGREMYIMRRGLVEVLSKEQNVMATLGPGGYFGEVGLIFGEPRTADVRAKTFCELAMLRKSDLDEVLVNFPLIEKQLEATGSNENVLRKIKEVAKQAGGTRKANRIDIIDKTRKLRSNSTFRRQSIIKELTEEETNVNEQLNKEFSEPYAGLHPILRFSSYFLMRNTINPNSMFFTTWTAVTVAVSCVYFCTLGFNIAFLKDNQILQILNYSFDFFFIVDIYIKMHVCFYNSDGVLVTHPTTTAKNYFRRSFILDFIAVLPIDAFLLNSSNGVYALGKLNRILHLIPVSQYFQYLDTPIQSGNSSIVRGIKFGTYMYLLTHLFACFWFLIGCPNNSSQINMKQQPTSRYDSHGKLHYRSLEYDVNKTYECIINSWAMQEGRDLGGESVYVQYITTMYWAAATTCSVGYGDIHPYVTDEMLLALVCMIVGVVFYGYIIASAAASLANADVQRARYQQKLDTINRFLKEQHIRADLEKRVKGFYEFMWNRNKGVDLENLFLGLPISLQADITLSLYKDIIESVPLFQGTELGFTKMLSLYIQPLLVPKGEYIVRKGDIGEE
uniref:Cyclic nucleotide-binding domain-containing protein n=1 Tax=Clytia hemisphaerica TaxID=252671 RepID=A0A7M5XLN7_9CNID